MKLVLIGPVHPFRGGIAHFTSMLVKEFSQWSSLLTISFKRLYPSWLYPGKSDRDPSREALAVDAKYLLDPLNPWTWWKTVRQVLFFKPDALIIEWWTTFLAPAFLFLAVILQRKGIPIIFLVHNVLPHEQRRIDPLLASLVLRRGQGYIVLTKNEKERLLALIPSAAPIEVCTHPKYDIFTHHHIPKQEARRKLDLPQDDNILLFFGIVRPYKGVEYFVASLADLAERGTKFFALIVGEWWMDPSHSRQMIQSSGLLDQVRVVDRYVPNEEVGLYFSAADVFLAPYIGGTQSGSVKIAIAFNLPIIVTERIAEGIQFVDPDLLYVVPQENASDLADAIEACLRKGLTNAKIVAQQVDRRDWVALHEAIENLVRIDEKKPPAEASIDI